MWAANAGPGDYFTYCNLGWGLIGTLMERITGERFDRLMQRLLLQPLGLQAGYHPSELLPQALANLATLYRKRTIDTEVWDANGPWIAQATTIVSVRRRRRPASSLMSSERTPRPSARRAACASRRATWER
jgi:CubicO group peptidase (beta-lactamase class C family)